MEIKASSVYTLEVIRDFAYLNVKTGSSPKKKVEALLILAAAMIALAVVIIIISDCDILMWIMIVIATITVLINGYLYFWLPRVRHKAVSSGGDIKNSFVFYDDGFEGFSTEKGFTGSAQIKYDTLYKIIESQKYFVIYESEKRAHIVEKNTIRNEELMILKRKFFDVL